VYLLGLNPQWQERLRQEVLALRAEVGESLPYERLGDLELVERAFKETLRLLPPVPSLPRRAVKAFEFMGHRIPAGTQVNISPLMTHRLPEHWPDPERFDPERFSPEQTAQRPRLAYMPFGGGQRLCIGNNFALMEATLIIAEVLQHFRLRAVPGHTVEPEPLVTLRPKGGLPMFVEPLHASA
jgi:cytochrome P450